METKCREAEKLKKLISIKCRRKKTKAARAENDAGGAF
jgi:hypothetical protein